MSSPTRYKKGDWKAVCDVCGQRFLMSKLRERWDGLMVCNKDFETRQPQDFVRAKVDIQAVPVTRPESTDYVFIHPTGSVESDLSTSIGSITFSGLAYNQNPITTNTTLTTETVVFVEGTPTVTLPLVPSVGQTIQIYNTGDEVIFINTGSSLYTGSPLDSCVCVWNGSSWEITGFSLYRTFAIWNPSTLLDTMTLSNGNLTATTGSSTGYNGVSATITKTTGKWYFEITRDGKVGSTSSTIYIILSDLYSLMSYENLGASVPFNADIKKGRFGFSLTTVSDTLKVNIGDVVGVAFDCDTGNIFYFINGVNLLGDGVAWFSLGGGMSYNPTLRITGGTTNGDSVTANFGVSAFVYAAPSGFNSGLYT